MARRVAPWIAPMPKYRKPRDGRWTAEKAREVLAAQRNSGLSAFAFAQREGLGPQRLYSWRRRLSDGADSRAHEPVQFVEVRSSATPQVEVLLGSGRMLRVSETIDPEVLLRLVAALEQQT
jgi:transposase-like protein